MPDAVQPTQKDHAGAKRSRNVAALALRLLAGAVTVAAVVGGAGWLSRERSKRRAERSSREELPETPEG
jgi:hypothetical protein